MSVLADTESDGDSSPLANRRRVYRHKRNTRSSSCGSSVSTDISAQCSSLSDNNESVNSRVSRVGSPSSSSDDDNNAPSAICSVVAAANSNARHRDSEYTSTSSNSDTDSSSGSSSNDSPPRSRSGVAMRIPGGDGAVPNRDIALLVVQGNALHCSRKYIYSDMNKHIYMSLYLSNL